MTEDPKNEYTREQLQHLAELLPDAVKTDEEGKPIFAFLSRENVRRLAQIHPELFRPQEKK